MFSLSRRRLYIPAFHLSKVVKGISRMVANVKSLTSPSPFLHSSIEALISSGETHAPPSITACSFSICVKHPITASTVLLSPAFGRYLPVRQFQTVVSETSNPRHFDKPSDSCSSTSPLSALICSIFLARAPLAYGLSLVARVVRPLVERICGTGCPLQAINLSNIQG